MMVTMVITNGKVTARFISAAPRADDDRRSVLAER
jgi:hypothetical protein